MLNYRQGRRLQGIIRTWQRVCGEVGRGGKKSSKTYAEKVTTYFITDRGRN